MVLFAIFGDFYLFGHGIAVIAGAITLGILNQIIRAGDQVKDSFHFDSLMGDHCWADVDSVLECWANHQTARIGKFDQEGVKPL